MVVQNQSWQEYAGRFTNNFSTTQVHHIHTVKRERECVREGGSENQRTPVSFFFCVSQQ